MNVYEARQRRQLSVIESIDGHIEEILTKYDNIIFVAYEQGEKLMGYDRNKNIFVVSNSYRESRYKFEEAINILKEIGLPIEARRTDMKITIVDENES